MRPMNTKLFTIFILFIIIIIDTFTTVATSDTVKGFEKITDPKTIIEPQNTGPACYPMLNNSKDVRTSFPDNYKALFIIAAVGSSASSTGSSYKYLRDRNVKSENIMVLCLSGPSSDSDAGAIYPTSALLMESYYPIGTIQCTPLKSFGKSSEKEVLNDLKTYDIIIIPCGYIATAENLRLNKDLQKAIVQFLYPSDNDIKDITKNSTLLLIGGAAELLVDTELIYNIKAKKPGPLNISINNSLPFISPSVSAAILRACGDVTGHPTSIDCGQDSGGKVKGIITREFTTTVNDGGDGKAHHRSLYVVTVAKFLGRLFPLYARDELSFIGDVGLDVNDIGGFPNCSNPKLTTPLPNSTMELLNEGMFHGVVSLILPTSEAWRQLAVKYKITTDATSQLTPKEIDIIVRNCMDPDGGPGDFCKGSSASLTVAHGSNDAEVIAVLTVLKTAQMDIKVVCPSVEEGSLHTDGVIYLSPQPSIFPTYRLKCDTYYDKSNLLLSSLVIVVGGPLATHRDLRFNNDLIYVLQRTGAFSLFGSAMSLLDLTLVGKELMRPSDVDISDVTVVPNCPDTDKDMEVLGFVNTNGPIYGPITLRNTEKMRTKVLCGYNNNNNGPQNGIRGNFTGFLSHTIMTLVWHSAQTQSTDIGVIVILVVGILLIVGVIISRCVEYRRSVDNKVSDSYKVRNVRSDEKTSLFESVEYAKVNVTLPGGKSDAL